MKKILFALFVILLVGCETEENITNYDEMSETNESLRYEVGMYSEQIIQQNKVIEELLEKIDVNEKELLGLKDEYENIAVLDSEVSKSSYTARKVQLTTELVRKINNDPIQALPYVESEILLDGEGTLDSIYKAYFCVTNDSGEIWVLVNTMQKKNSIGYVKLSSIENMEYSGFEVIKSASINDIHLYEYSDSAILKIQGRYVRTQEGYYESIVYTENQTFAIEEDGIIDETINIVCDSRTNQIQAIVVMSPLYTLDTGITVGDNTNEVLEVYGEYTTELEDNKIIIHIDDKSTLVFYLQEDKIFSFRLVANSFQDGNIF